MYSSHLLRIFFFGLGYTARALISQLSDQGWHFFATARSNKTAELGSNVSIFPFVELGSTAGCMKGTAILSSVPPDISGDPVLIHHRDWIIKQRPIWVGYLSTTGVYGDHGGALVDETTELCSTTERGQRRIKAEADWLNLWHSHGVPVHIFRISGIYGPGRNRLAAARAGTVPLIIKQGHFFNRIHVEDLAIILAASLYCPHPGDFYNIGDDEPAPSGEVITYTYHLVGRSPPPPIQFETASLSPMAASFYSENKRISNKRLKKDFNLSLRYPNYRLGLASLLASGE